MSSRNSTSTLFDQALLSVDEKNFDNQKRLEYVSLPDSVGVATEQYDGRIIYVAYQNDERGNLEIKKTFNSFSPAVKCAREMYEGLRAYYNGIYTDFAKINSPSGKRENQGKQQTSDLNTDIKAKRIFILQKVMVKKAAESATGFLYGAAQIDLGLRDRRGGKKKFTRRKEKGTNEKEKQQVKIADS